MLERSMQTANKPGLIQTQSALSIDSPFLIAFILCSELTLNIQIFCLLSPLFCLYLFGSPAATLLDH